MMAPVMTEPPNKPVQIGNIRSFLLSPSPSSTSPPTCGKREANMRPTLLPRRVPKLLSTSSGLCWVARP
jgi:hypothetical protein